MTPSATTLPEHVDVLIVGAGISGISAAHHLQQDCPDRSYAILESRSVIGGTWDLFRYPGVRSDSDIHTLGFRFKPWTGRKSIADGDTILEYIHQAAREDGSDRRIHFDRRAARAEWSSAESRWTVEVENTAGAGTERITCDFLWNCSGYFRYDDGHAPDFPGRDRFHGTVVHPQRWPEDLDYSGKRVVVIGSGATAITLVPAMATKAAKVTMLQRSPTWVMSRPTEPRWAVNLKRFLPARAAHALIRWKDIAHSGIDYALCRIFPGPAKRVFRIDNTRGLPKGYDIDTHFTPSYNPWTQRPCAVADGDLYREIRAGRVDVVTDRIETFTESGLTLESGAELEADVIVTATGFNLQFLGGMEISVDGEGLDLPSRRLYRGSMLRGVPNFALSIGYVNASWTLKAELTGDYVCRLLNHMAARGYATAVPEASDAEIGEAPVIDFSSGYVQRALDQMPKQGLRPPWRLRENYFLDRAVIGRGEIEDGALRFSSRAAEPARSGTLVS